MKENFIENEFFESSVNDLNAIYNTEEIENHTLSIRKKKPATQNNILNNLKKYKIKKEIQNEDNFVMEIDNSEISLLLVTPLFKEESKILKAALDDYHQTDPSEANSYVDNDSIDNKTWKEISFIKGKSKNCREGS
jgi:hypothetical protein